MVANTGLDRVGDALFCFDRAVEDSLLVGIERQDAFLFLDEGNRLVGNFFGPLFMFFAAEDLERIFNLEVFGLFVQFQGSFQRQYTHNRFVDSFHRQDAVFNALLHILEVFSHVLVEQEDVRAAGDRVGNRFASVHRDGEAGHRGRVGADNAVKAEVFTEQAVRADHFGRKGRGHDIFVLDIGVDLLSPCRLHDVADHDGQCAFFDGSLIVVAVGRHPVFAGHIVD